MNTRVKGFGRQKQIRKSCNRFIKAMPQEAPLHLPNPDLRIREYIYERFKYIITQSNKREHNAEVPAVLNELVDYMQRLHIDDEAQAGNEWGKYFQGIMEERDKTYNG